MNADKRRGLEIFLAEKVMGWYLQQGWFRHRDNLVHHINEWHPTTNLNAAFELLSKLKEPHVGCTLGGGWYATASNISLPPPKGYARDESPALAICLAVARAYGWEE